MRKAMKIAAFGLAAGAAVMVAGTAPVLARGGFGPGDGDALTGRGGGIFAIQFADLDTDGDGKITEAELTARAEALVAGRLAEVDTDGDGMVTAAEIEAQALARIEARGAMRPGAMDPAQMAKTMAERMIAARDTDGDGQLSGAELSPELDVATLVDRFDTDDDNAWSAEEFASVQTMGERARGGFDGHGDRAGKGGHGDRGGRQGGADGYGRR